MDHSFLSILRRPVDLICCSSDVDKNWSEQANLQHGRLRRLVLNDNVGDRFDKFVHHLDLELQVRGARLLTQLLKNDRQLDRNLVDSTLIGQILRQRFAFG